MAWNRQRAGPSAQAASSWHDVAEEGPALLRSHQRQAARSRSVAEAAFTGARSLLCHKSDLVLAAAGVLRAAGLLRSAAACWAGGSGITATGPNMMAEAQAKCQAAGREQRL